MEKKIHWSFTLTTCKKKKRSCAYCVLHSTQIHIMKLNRIDMNKRNNFLNKDRVRIVRAIKTWKWIRMLSCYGRCLCFVFVVVVFVSFLITSMCFIKSKLILHFVFIFIHVTINRLSYYESITHVQNELAWHSATNEYFSCSFISIAPWMDMYSFCPWKKHTGLTCILMWANGMTKKKTTTNESCGYNINRIWSHQKSFSLSDSMGIRTIMAMECESFEIRFFFSSSSLYSLSPPPWIP